MTAAAKPIAALWVALALIAGAASTAAAAPCGGLKVADGFVEFGANQRLEDVKTERMETCLAAVVKELQGRSGVRSVTVAARVSGGDQVRRDAAKVAEYVRTRLVALGLDQERISTVVPQTAPGEPEGLRIAFLERHSFRPVAQVWSLSGKVWTGEVLGSLTPAVAGKLMSPQQYVETGQGSVAFVFLLDGSRLWVAPESLVRIGGVTYSEEAGRNVQLELLRGHAQVFAAKRDGPLKLITGNAIAGVRGTAFRVALPEDKTTRLETTDGTIMFSGARAQVFVTHGEGSRVDNSGYPEAVRPLLLEPKIIRPVLGTHGFGELLSWTPVPEADGYRVEYSRTAQFDDHYWDVSTKREQVLINEAHTPGKWFWRVTAIDRDGFAGFSSKVYAFTVPGPAAP